MIVVFAAVTTVVSGPRISAMPTALLVVFSFVSVCTDEVLRAQDRGVPLSRRSIRWATTVLMLLFAMTLGAQAWTLSGSS